MVFFFILESTLYPFRTDIPSKIQELQLTVKDGVLFEILIYYNAKIVYLYTAGLSGSRLCRDATCKEYLRWPTKYVV
mgnify:CR=1 FL=1